MQESAFERFERFERWLFALSLLLIGIGGGVVLVVATATGTDITTYANFYAPVNFVVLVLALFALIVIESGRAAFAGKGFPVERTLRGRALATVVRFTTALVLLGLFGVGALWAIGQIAAGLDPTTATFVAGGVLLVYAALRTATALGVVDGHELARAIGIRPAGPEPGESAGSFFARLLSGFVIGIPIIDALIVGVNALLAPGDKTFYPYVSAITPLAAILWLIGLLGLGSAVSRWIRTRAPRITIWTGLAVAALIPAIALDARVPLHPFLSGIASGGWTVSAGPVTLSAPSQTPIFARTPIPSVLPTRARPIANGAMISGTVRWAEAPVAFATVTVIGGDRAVMTVSTDINGTYQATVPAGTISVSVDPGAAGAFYSASRPGSLEVKAGGEAVFPPIQMVRQIGAMAPQSGATIDGASTFRWSPTWSTQLSVTYELRVEERTPSPPPGGAAPAVFVGRTTQMSLGVPALAAGRPYRWSVSAYVTGTDGQEMLIGRGGGNFTTR